MSAPSTRTAQPSRRLLMVGIDALDWDLVNPLLDGGKMPVFNCLVEGGASGRLLCPTPMIGPSLWASIVTGKRPWQHGICQSSEPVEQSGGRKPLCAQSFQATPVWNILAGNDRKCIVVGWPATHGTQAEGVTVVSDAYFTPTAGPGVHPWPSPPAGTYWPGTLGARLDPLRASPEQIQADVVSLYLPHWEKIDQRRDPRLSLLRALLARDFSALGASIEILRNQAWDFAAVRFPAMAEIARSFLPYHGPLRSSVNQQDSFLYGEVMNSHCRMVDLLVQQLRQAAGPQTAMVVVSNHGLRSFDVSPEGPPSEDAELWKSSYALFVGSGPGFAPDALLHGASVMDVAPTVLTWFGVPIGDDMEGRVLIESFSAAPDVRRVPSWDVAYRERKQNAGASEPHWRWNFVRSALEAGQIGRSMPVIESLFQEFPERTDVAEALFECQLELKRTDAAAQTLEILLEGVPPGAAAMALQAQLAWVMGAAQKARSLVDAALRLRPTDRPTLGRLGILLLRLREWDRLEELSREGIALDELDAIAWLGLATALLRKGQAAEAAEAAQRAIGLKYFLPDAHFVLLRALIAQGLWAEAREVMAALRQFRSHPRT